MSKELLQNTYYSMIAANASAADFYDFDLKYFEATGEVINEDILDRLSVLTAKEALLLRILDRDF